MKKQPPAAAAMAILDVFPPNSILLKLLSTLLIIIFVLGVVVAGIISTYSSLKYSVRNNIQLKFLTLPPPPPPSTTATDPNYTTTNHDLPMPPPPPSPPPPPPPPVKLITSRGMGLKGYVVEPSRSVMHDMTDEELLRRAAASASSMVKLEQRPLDVDVDVVRVAPKVAFMFLVRGGIPFAPLWEKFFKGHRGLYSIYVHPDPNSYNDHHTSLSLNSVFYGRRVPSKVVRWGEANMMDAERRLLANALLDSSNQRFVLLSESCIPLYNLPTIYSYLMNSSQSFVQVHDEPGRNGRGRYNRRMRPKIRLKQWRKGSQWFEMDRGLAVEVISDDVYYPVFRKHCKRYVDEHYLPTLVNIKFGARNGNRSLTWVDWSKGGPHPARIGRPDVNPHLLSWIMRSGAGGHHCTYNGRKTTMCYLFARKFLPNCLNRLEKYAPKLLGFGT